MVGAQVVHGVTAGDVQEMAMVVQVVQVALVVLGARRLVVLLALEQLLGKSRSPCLRFLTNFISGQHGLLVGAHTLRGLVFGPDAQLELPHLLLLPSPRLSPEVGQ